MFRLSFVVDTQAGSCRGQPAGSLERDIPLSLNVQVAILSKVSLEAYAVNQQAPDVSVVAGLVDIASYQAGALAEKGMAALDRERLTLAIGRRGEVSRAHYKRWQG